MYHGSKGRRKVLVGKVGKQASSSVFLTLRVGSLVSCSLQCSTPPKETSQRKRGESCEKVLLCERLHGQCPLIHWHNEQIMCSEQLIPSSLPVGVGFDNLPIATIAGGWCQKCWPGLGWMCVCVCVCVCEGVRELHASKKTKHCYGCSSA